MAEKKRFPWGCVLGGCAVTVIGVIAVVAGVGYLGFQKAKEMGEEIRDPERRAEKVMEVLGAETLPEGLYPGISLSVPFIVDIAFLVDNPPQANGEPGDIEDRGFIYFSVLTSGGARRELEDFFEGKRNDAELLRQNNIDLDLDQLLGRGTIDMGDGPLRWIAYRGRLDSHGSHGEALITMLQADCSDSRMRLGIWIRPASEAPDQPLEAPDQPLEAPDQPPEVPEQPPEVPEQPPEVPEQPLEAPTEGPIPFEVEVANFAGHFRFCDS